MFDVRDKQAVLIDFDGTLADSVAHLSGVLDQFLLLYRLEIDSLERESFNGPPIREIVRMLKSTHGLQDSLIMMKNKYLMMAAKVYGEVRPTLGAISFLSAIKEKCSVVVVTSNTRDIVCPWLTMNKLDRYVDGVIDCDDVTQGKPFPDPYIKAMAFAKCNVQQAIAIEDSALGALSATRAGVKTYCIGPAKQEWVVDYPDLKELVFVNSLHDMLSSKASEIHV